MAITPQQQDMFKLLAELWKYFEIIRQQLLHFCGQTLRLRPMLHFNKNIPSATQQPHGASSFNAFRKAVGISPGPAGARYVPCLHIWLGKYCGLPVSPSSCYNFQFKYSSKRLMKSYIFCTFHHAVNRKRIKQDCRRATLKIWFDLLVICSSWYFHGLGRLWWVLWYLTKSFSLSEYLKGLSEPWFRDWLTEWLGGSRGFLQKLGSSSWRLRRP